MLAVGPLGPQYSLLFAWHELGSGPIWGVDTLHSQRVPKKILRDKCDMTFEKKPHLYLHKSIPELETNENSTQMKYPCNQDECKFSADDVRNLVKHMLEKHTNPILAAECDQCGFITEDIGALKVHKITTQEIMKRFFNAMPDGMVETNETIKQVLLETNERLDKIGNTGTNETKHV